MGDGHCFLSIVVTSAAGVGNNLIKEELCARSAEGVILASSGQCYAGNKVEFLCSSFPFYYVCDGGNFSERCNCTHTFRMFAIQLFKFRSRTTQFERRENNILFMFFRTHPFRCGAVVHSVRVN